ncbi:hypothetical protein [Trueperella pecoris]|nr:hypothetical protein [Trueperella pecoris]
MALISTDSVKAFLPHNVADGMIKETQSLSTIARLFGREPI